MKKLELKHLAPYLPYGLKYKDIPNGYQKERILRIETVKWCLDNGKPILRPLSDLTKPIKVEGYNDGKEFVPMKELLDNYGKGGEYEQSILKAISSKGHFIMTMPYASMQLLFEWHFDVFGLIKEDLAIDINTLNK